MQGRRHRQRRGVRRPRPRRPVRADRRRGPRLGGATPADSYLDIAKIIAVAEKSGADSVHPGYGFLAENAEFAQAVIDAGLDVDRPAAVRDRGLGDKVRARHIAEKVGAPLAPGTKDPLENADEVVAFAKEHGLPIAIKAVVRRWRSRPQGRPRDVEEVADAFESAVREAVSAFGRGECFVEKFLDQPRHVETQCLADQHGNVVVVSTRDCSLQRRHQKLVEEAPAPFLTDDQVAKLYESSKAILREAGYVGAGTCEFLVAKDGTISFLEVNTRLQVEHCVSEEVTGIDLVREMFRIAAGEELGYDDPTVSGHSIEYRINAEDGGANFMPAPGTLSGVEPAAGPGRPARRRLRERRDDPGRVRLPHRQADRDRPRPHPGARALAPRPRRVRGRRHADRDPVPPRGRQRPGVRRRRRRRSSVYTHLDRDRLRQPDHAVRRGVGRGRRAGRAADRGRRGRRQAARGRHPGRARRAGGRDLGGAKKPQAGRRQEGRRRGQRRRRDQPDAGHRRQGRGRGGPGASSRATPSWSSRR